MVFIIQNVSYKMYHTECVIQNVLFKGQEAGFRKIGLKGRMGNRECFTETAENDVKYNWVCIDS